MSSVHHNFVQVLVKAMCVTKGLALLLLVIGAVRGVELGHATLIKTPIEGRITGGVLAAEHQFPYQVGLSIEIVPGQFTWCGGSLISNLWVITAAHCVNDISGISVYLGSTKRLEPSKVLKVSPSDIHVHQQFDSRSLANDIALLNLPIPVTISDGIRPIALPKMAATYSTYAYHEAIATGWGQMSDASAAISNELRYVVQFVESNADCQFSYGSSIKPTNICIDTTGGKSTCTGDSGGPLAVHSSDGLVLIGISSFGKSSGCTKGYPAVFTRITSYLDWIHAVSGVAHF